VPPSSLRPLQQELENTPPGVLLKKYKTQPGISDLKHLQQVNMDLEEFRFKITDIGGYLGYAAASPTLQRISFTTDRVWVGGKLGLRRRNILISEKCKAVIRKALGPLLTITLD
jgi:hypothetical protein